MSLHLIVIYGSVASKRMVSYRAMTHDASQAARFVISAKRKDGSIQQTRKQAASAIVLALAWLEAGHADVTVIDPTGKQLNPATYQANGLRDRPRGW